MANNLVKGLGAGSMEWAGDFVLTDTDQSTALFTVSRTAGTVTFGSSASLVRTAQKRTQVVGAKVGATSGWVVDAADNKNSLARLPASQSGSTLVVPLTGLKVGDTITSYHLVGQIESAGGTVTVDCALRKQTAAAADLTDALCTNGDMVQLSVTADTIMSLTNTSDTPTAEVVGVDETFYLLITATTAGSTDIDLQAVAITVTES